MAHTLRIQRSRRAAIASAVAVLTLAVPMALSACTTAGAAPTESSGSSSASTSSSADTQVHVIDAWAKATSEDMVSGKGMTGVFATLENHGDADLTISSVSSDSAGHVELHEVVDGQMREIAGDVVIPAGGSLLLEPGGNHIMLMEMEKPLLPGDEASIEVHFSDGSSTTFMALVKDTAGANESYHDSDDGHDSHDGL